MRGPGRGAAEPHPLKRPLDGPAGAGQPLEKVRLRADGVDQYRPGFGSDNLMDQRERAIRTIGKQGTDVPGLAAIADKCRRAAARHQPRAPPSAPSGQQSAAIESHGPDIARYEFIETVP